MPIRDVPYSPSFVLDLTAEVDERIRNVVDFVFLPGFNNPTIAVLYQQQQTWTGYVLIYEWSAKILISSRRLKEFKDTFGMIIFTLDVFTRTCPIITTAEGLPYDSLSITACSSALGGVIVSTSNSLIHIDQTSRRVALPVNGWLPRISDSTTGQAAPDLDLSLEGSKIVFVDDKTLFAILKDGSVFPVEIVSQGRTVSGMKIGAAVARTTIPALVKRVPDDHVFVGSIVGPSVLLKTARVEEDIVEEADADLPAAAVVDQTDAMDLDDDDGRVFHVLYPRTKH